MSDNIQVEKTMDLKGLPCPMPVVKVSKGIKEVEIGQIIEALSTDPGSLTTPVPDHHPGKWIVDVSEVPGDENLNAVHCGHCDMHGVLWVFLRYGFSGDQFFGESLCLRGDVEHIERPDCFQPPMRLLCITTSRLLIDEN